LIGSPAAGLQAVRWRNRRTKEEKECNVRQVFLFIGADPNAEWLKQCAVIVDAKGFVQTGDALAPECRDDSATRQLPLETSQPGVFAVGDVRAGSVKRVASAVGEGAAVVAQIHGYFEELKRTQPAGEKS
jgi:thioredoxin reductase (NADPH)